MHSFPDKQKILLELVSLLSKILDLSKDGNLAHGLRVADLSQAIAKQINIGNPAQLNIAGLLHDIGGMNLKRHVLYHALDSFQDMEARNHASYGAEILQSFYPFHFLVGWVADHHERYDGTGFPAGKSQYEISSEAGILHLADLLDIFFRQNKAVTLKEIRIFLNQQSGSSVSPVVVEGAKRLFSTPESLVFLKESDPRECCGQGMVDFLAEINFISVPELISQLLWLTAQVADSKVETGGFHSNRVAFYCHRIAKAFHSHDVDPLQALWAGLLHDVGICATPKEELNGDRGHPATASFLYRQHPRVSANLVAEVKVLRHFAPVLLSHHEHWDGTGFPAGLKGKEIPLLSQIIHICEQYDMLSRVLVEGIQGNHQYAIDELENGRDQLFSSDLLDRAIPVLQTWGQRDISWMRDIKNVHAFFTSDPFDGIYQGQEEAASLPDPEGSNCAFVPRQWECVELTEDYGLGTGGNTLKDFVGIKGVTNFFDIVEPSVVGKTRKNLVALEDGGSLTLTLVSKRGKPLELIFLKQKNGYKLLYRGVNETPLFTRKHSIFYQHFQNTPEAELILDEETVIQDVNESALLLLGGGRHGLIGKSIGMLFSPFLSKAQLSSLHMLLAGDDGTLWIEEFSFINKQGTAFSIQVTIVLLQGFEHRDVAYLCRLRDVSLQKELEQEMEHRDKAMQLIVHNISGMTGDRFFKELLLQFASLCGAGLVMIGELIDDDTAVRPIVFKDHGGFRHRKSFLLENTPGSMVVHSGEVFFADGARERFPLDEVLQNEGHRSYWGLPLRNQKGKILGLLEAMDGKSILRSKSIQALVKILQSLAGSELARMQVERRLKENERLLEGQNLELSRMNQLKSDMIAVTSHDLKSPLAAIIGYASLLEEYFSSLDEAKKIYYIHRIEEEGQKQLVFINKLLDLYRIESGTIDLELVSERLDFLVRECITRQQHVGAERNIRIEMSTKGVLTPTLFDPLRMEQVISNILSNSIKFSPADRRIMVFFYQDKQNLTVEICDRGKGIDEEEMVNIFDRYYMGRTNFDVRPEGSGLGLYIVKNIVNLHGGEVFARNRKRGGSCFTVRIPVKTNESAMSNE